MTYLKMADSITAADLPNGYDAYAGYLPGPGINPNFVSYPGIVARFGHTKAHLVSIAAHEWIIGQMLDMEAGDATPDKAPGWFELVTKHGITLPIFYTFQAQMSAVQAAISRIPRHEYKLLVAAFPGTGAVVPAGMDGHQWADHGEHGENYDRSVLLPDFFSKPAPKPHEVRAEAELTYDHPSGQKGKARVLVTHDLGTRTWRKHKLGVAKGAWSIRHGGSK